MKKLLLAILLAFVNSEAFAIEQCPTIIRLADLKKIAKIQENDSFEMKGETWTLTYSNGSWQPLLEKDAPIGDSFQDSRIIMKQSKEILHCEYQIFTVRENKWHHMDQKRGDIFIETIIKD
jgi:hypothetical protein